VILAVNPSKLNVSIFVTDRLLQCLGEGFLATGNGYLGSVSKKYSLRDQSRGPLGRYIRVNYKSRGEGKFPKSC